MDRWQSLIDRQLNQAKQDGELSNLPGEGKPLNLEGDTFTPADKKIAYKIMLDNNIAPDWIALGQELDDRRAKLRGDLRRAATGNDKVWQRAQNGFRVAAQRYNKELLSYNLKLPPGFNHKHQLDPEREIKQVQQHRS
jgi:hypothetical protein